MHKLSHYISQQLQIVQPSIWKRVYELRTESELLLTISYPKIFSSLAVIDGFGQTWEIQKPSIWKRNLDIKRKLDQLPFARYIPGKWRSGGMFELPNGARIEYAANVWKRTNELLSQQKVKLISLKRTSLWKSALSVTIEHESDLIDTHPWIIMTVYYQILERRQHQHAAM